MEAEVLALNESPRHGGEIPLHHLQVRRSLLLWSGGVDSTYALVRLLRTTQDQVFTHHVRITCANSDARCDFEHAAIIRLRAWLHSDDRAFVHTGSSLGLAELSGRGADSSMLMFMAAQAAMTHELTPFDRILIGVNADLDPGWDPDTAACALRRLRMARALRAAWGCDEVPQIYLWLPRPRRAQMIATLGPELHALTASCSQPVRAPCGGVGNAHAPTAAESDISSASNRTGTLRACGHCMKCRLRAGSGQDHKMNQHRTYGHVSRDDRPPGGAAVRGAVTRTPHLFHHLERLSNKKPELPRAAATSDPLAP